MAENKRTQANRLLAINTPLGEDVVLLRGFHMTEELGRPFTAELDLRSEKHDIAMADLIGKNCTIRLLRTDGQTRYVNGYVSRMVQEGTPGEGRANQFRATLVPWLWFLTRSIDCKIFQNLSVLDVILKVFRDAGFSDFKVTAATGDYTAREYIVQYRESAFNFVSRLMEEVGLYYYFEHENGKHTMVIADSVAKLAEVAGYEKIPYIQQSSGNVGVERVWEWAVEQQLQTKSFVIRDFDFMNPNVIPEGKKDAAQGIESVSTAFDFPGRIITAAQAETLAGRRADESVSQFELCRARGDLRGLTLGARFTLDGFPREDQHREYVVVSLACHAETDDYSSGKSSGNELFQCGFTAMPADREFRTARLTPKPLICGPQHAVVTGQSGEEVFTDEHGRVKVIFPWDRHSEADEQSSCWIRVAQVWAGKGWGGMFIPRIGQEVIVEFAEGDPDRPIVTGRLYNGLNAPPYPLPDNKTMSTLKSSSSKGGSGFNEFRFEDKAGEEQIFIHAQKNMDIRVLNDRFETVGHDRHLIVENKKYEWVKIDREELVEGNHKEEIVKDRNLTVGGKEAVEITGSKSLTVKDKVIEIFKADQSTQVTGEVHIKADTIILEATTNITIKVGGGSYMAIDSSSLDIKSTNVTYKADAAMKQEAGTGFEAKGLTMKVEGSTTADFKGGAAATLDGGASTTVKGGMISVG
ncbi:MAG: type VI secretion system Vgr family protein [Phycisphaerales bacterium]